MCVFNIFNQILLSLFDVSDMFLSWKYVKR